MSAIKLKGNPLGAGNFSIEAPAAAGDRVLTLPDRAGRVTLDGPAFHAYRLATAAVLVSTAWTRIAVETEVLDTDNCYDTSTWRFTPNVEGYYCINASAYVTQSSSSSIASAIYINGTQVQQSTTVISTSGVAAISALNYLNGTTDYVELYAYGGGASPVIQPSYTGTYLQGFFVRKA